MVGAVLFGCANKTYSPLESAKSTSGTLHHTSSAPQMVVLPQESAPVIGLDNLGAEPLRPNLRTNVASAPEAPLSRGWVPVRQWAQRIGAETPQQIAAGSAVAFRIKTTNGWCKLTIGTRLAQWNGVAVWLGFAPQMLNGEPQLHTLDAEKTLLPLAQPPPVLAPNRTVVLDPGHGGADSGTRDAQNRLEKDYALDWALRTERLLTNAGWKVFLTRRGDVDVSLAERVAFADRVKADLFISLHFNSTFPQTQASGIETYCLTPAGMPSTLVRGYADDARSVFPNNQFDTANMALAYRIQHSLLSQTKTHDAGIKRARFMTVLRGQNRPAILVEGGFLSNVAEASAITAGSHREVLAQAIGKALEQ